MPPVIDNPLVGFLSSYGPSPSSDTLVDEHVRRAVKRHGVAPIETPAPKLAAVRKALLGADPISVILTGTAGDGKTYHIRQFFFDEVGGADGDWPGGGVLEAVLPSGKPLRIICDLSQLTDTAKAGEIRHVTRCLLGEDTETLYLLAANDGQLLKFWRDAMEAAGTGDAERERFRDVLAALTDMLHRDHDRDDAGRLRVAMLNLSRTATERTLDQVFNGILEHPAWTHGCDACPSGPQGTDRCPIRINREILRGRSGSSAFRHRLKQALRIAAMNDQHVPIRQILILAVNILLGDSKRRDRPLLACADARKRAKEGDYRCTNPYNNALGLNVREEKRRSIGVFSVLGTFGIGFETSNPVDALLMGNSAATIGNLEAADRTYGRTIFEARLQSYTRGDDPGQAESFAAALEAQRRRMFFLLDERWADAPLPWQLTVLHHASDYLALCAAAEPAVSDPTKQADPAAVDNVLRKLVKGLNRTLTGMMVEDTEKLWLARSIGRAEGTVGRFTMLSPVRRRGAGEYLRLKLSLNQAIKRPRLSIIHRLPGGPTSESTPLDLRPLLFEYLMRVAHGSLPSSFSRQCQQEVRHFALSATSFIGARFDEDEEQPLQILSVTRDGTVAAREIEG